MRSYSEYVERINEIITEAKKIIEYYKSINDEWITREIEKVEKRLNIQIKDEKEFDKDLYIPQGYKSVKEYLEAHKNDDPHVVLEEIKKVLEEVPNYCMKIWSYFNEELPRKIGLESLLSALSIKSGISDLYLIIYGDREKAERLEKAIDVIMPSIENLKKKIQSYLYEALYSNSLLYNSCRLASGLLRLLWWAEGYKYLLAGDYVPINGDKIDEKAFKDEYSIQTYYYYMMSIFSDKLEKAIEPYKDEIDKYPPQISMRDIIAYLFELRNKAREKWMIVYDYYVKTGLLKKVEDEIRAEWERRKRVREEVQKELIKELEKIFVSS